MSSFTASDLDLSDYSEKNKWQNGLECQTGPFGVLQVSTSACQKEYYSVDHDYVQATACACSHNHEGHKYCKHMAVADYVLSRRKERLARGKKQSMVKPVVADPVTDKMLNASLKGNGGFSFYR